MEGIGWFSHEILKRLAQQHPEHDFYFIFDRPYSPIFLFGPNVHPIVIGPPARHPFLFVLWFEWSLKRALDRIKPDVFFSPDGFLSLSTDIPSVPVIHDLNFEHFPEDLPWLVRKYYQYYFPKFAVKAKRVITVSEFSKHDIVQCYNISPELITVAYNGLRENFKPESELNRQKFRVKKTSGKNYFLFVGALHPRKNIHRLLQAYDIYRSNGGETNRLLIVGGTYWWNKTLKQAYEGMIYRDEVVFSGHLAQNDLAMAMASAEALVYVPYFEGFGVPIIEAFACGTPVIAGNLSSLPEVAGGAALLVDPMDPQQIADGMKRLQSDSELRSRLIEAGLKRAQEFNWDKSAEIVWHVIEKVLKQEKHA